MVATSVKHWTPRPYQPLMVKHIINHPRCALFAEMGLGKSSATLAAIVGLMLMGEVKRVLIIAPLRVARTTWPNEVADWSDFSHLRVSVVQGSDKQRRAALSIDADICTTNMENVPWLVEEMGEAWPWDMVVLDELSRWKSARPRQGGMRAKALLKVIHTKVKRVVGLTGTPCPQGLNDLFGQMFILDGGMRLGRTYNAYMARWFRARPGGNPMYPVLIPMPHSQGEIEVALKDVCLTIKSADWFDLGAPIVNKIYVELPPKARAQYKQMQTNMFAELDGKPIEAFAASAKSQKLLQMAAGCCYVDGDTKDWVVTHDEKLEALHSIVAEHPGCPLLVAYHHRSSATRIERAFPHARRLDSDPDTVREWNDGEIQMLLAHPASAGHGLNLARGGNVIAFFEANWNLEEHLQVIERIGPTRQKQAGLDRPVFIHFIIARSTVDEMVLERLASKRSVQEIFMDAMKRHKLEGREC